MFGGVAAIAIVAIWYFMIFGKIGSDTDAVSDEIDAARAEQQSLEAELRQLEAIEERLPETQAELEDLRGALPQAPQLAAFINEANAIAAATRVSWVSVSPSEPIQTGSVATTQMTIEVGGGYYEVLDYLHRLEGISRLVVVDSLNLTAEGGEQGAVAGAPQLRASLVARMFSLGTASTVPTTTTVPAGTGQV
jgi:Tfp pilus assembly protein PilO